MNQRPPPCAYQAPSPPVPPTTMPTDSAALYTAGWPHHPDAAYRPLLPGTVVVPMSDHRQTSTAGYSCSPYSEPPTFSQMGITPPGHVTRWWVREGWGHMVMRRTFRIHKLNLCHVDLIVRHRMIGFRCYRWGRCRCRLWGWDRCQHRQRCRPRLWGWDRC
jgi:hypothetical protein